MTEDTLNTTNIINTTNTTNTWIKKYAPKKLSELVCNVNTAKTVKTWISQWNINKQRQKQQERRVLKASKQSKRKSVPKEKIPPSCLLITGNHGVGKTTTVKLVLENAGYDVHTVDFNEVKITKNIKQCLDQIIKTNDVVDMIFNKPRKKVLLFDEIESLSAPVDKAFLIALQKMNDLERLYPIIFIANNKHNKFLSDLKKKTTIVRFWDPWASELTKILRKICIKEKLLIKSSKAIDVILEMCQSDVRRLIQTLQDVHYTYGSDVKISKKMIVEYKNTSKTKDVDTDLYNATRQLLYSYKNVDDCMSYYESEKTSLPLMVHQNYIDSVLLRYKKEDDRFATVSQVSELLSQGDIVDNFIYSNQSWDMQPVHGFYSCVAPSYSLTKQKKTKTKSKTNTNTTKSNTNTTNTDSDSSSDDDDVIPTLRPTFTIDFHKTSAQKNNQKKIVDINLNIPNKNISDYIYIIQIMRNLVTRDKIKECVDIMYEYGISIEVIEAVLKIDKIDNAKPSLTTRQKREFVNQYELHNVVDLNL